MKKKKIGWVFPALFLPCSYFQVEYSRRRIHSLLVYSISSSSGVGVARFEFGIAIQTSPVQILQVFPKHFFSELPYLISQDQL